jgi:hypothetical protein
MQKIILSLLCAAALFAQTANAQSWADLGSSESTNSHITRTAAFALYLQSSQAGEPCFSFIDDDFGPNNAGDFKIHFRKFNGTQWVDLGSNATPSIPANDFFPIAFDGNTTYMAYSEPAHLSLPQKLTVRKFNSSNSQWETVGAAGFSAAAANSTAIAAANNKVFVAYADESASGKITVKMFDNANTAAGWQTLGTTGFSAGSVFPNVGNGISLVMDNAELYVAYTDMSLSGGTGALAVKKFNGTAWQDVGTNSPSNDHLSLSATLRFDGLHTAYVAYMDAFDAKGYVRKLVGNQWVSLGLQPPASQVFSGISLHILQNNVFVAFSKPDAVNTSVAAVKKFDDGNNNWVDVGNAPITNGATGVTNIALESNGVDKLFLVYRNGNGAIFAKSFDASSILPITLKSFTASKEGSSSLLNWATSHETNNLHFEVQHSIDGVNFKAISTVVSKGNTSTGHQYTFTHALPVKGINYYRLKQVDKSGSFTFSNIVNVEFNQTAIVINVFPNPVKDILHLQHSMNGLQEILLKDATGRTIKQVRIGALSIDIPVNDLSSGTYFVCLVGSNGTETKLFVK